MEIEATRAVVDETPPPRRRARLRSTHHSTRIEGNRLTLAEAEEAISGREIEEGEGLRRGPGALWPDGSGAH